MAPFVALSYLATMKQGRLSNRIRAARKRVNLSQEQLAALIGVTAGTVHRWERGTVAPTLDHLRAVATATKTTLAKLAG